MKIILAGIVIAIVITLIMLSAKKAIRRIEKKSKKGAH